ncbi:MAG: DNA photolyase family protein [Alphaproteobacteria bacterium]
MSEAPTRNDRLPPPVIVWLRRDLRIDDNPALVAAAESGGPVIPVYIHDEDTAGRWAVGGAGRWWLGRSLAALAGVLAERGASLVLRRGVAAAVIADLVAETGARAVVWNRCHEPFAVARDAAIAEALAARGIAVRAFDAALLHDPGRVATRSGGPFQSFAQFWRECQSLPPPGPPLAAPARFTGPERLVLSEELVALGLAPSRPDWAEGLASAWSPGSVSAVARLEEFIDRRLAAYHLTRNDPDRGGTSRLSPHLGVGEISPRQVVHAIHTRGEGLPAEPFLRELYWREFSYHLLHHRPDMPDVPLRPEFADFPWAEDSEESESLARWTAGRTGYPIVDAGMRALWHTGWMHNRARLIVASFLVKDLLLPWQLGEAWFWESLVDADLAVNAVNWQWVAGCGVDAAPYFRIFNPVLQGEKFDPRGRYVRRWLPELEHMPDMFIHRPWEAPPAVLAKAGVVLDRDYPRPIVDHALARRRALSAYQQALRQTPPHPTLSPEEGERAF